MPRKRRSVWKPEPTVISIGGIEYDVVPQSMRRYLEFEERLRELIAGFTEEEELEAEAPEEVEEIPEDLPTKLYVEQGVEAIYEVLHCAIPDLDIDDVWNSPEPELEHALQVVLQVNGGRWAQALIQDFFQPLLPALHAWIVELLGSTAGLIEAESSSGETQ